MVYLYSTFLKSHKKGWFPADVPKSLLFVLKKFLVMPSYEVLLRLKALCMRKKKVIGKFSNLNLNAIDFHLCFKT